MIQPTVGRMVHFYIGQGSEPNAAIIAHVHNDRMVNLCVIDEGGGTTGVSSVPLVQEDDEKPLSYFCEWMPYQKGQAAKTEAAEEELEAERTG